MVMADSYDSSELMGPDLRDAAVYRRSLWRIICCVWWTDWSCL